MLQHKALFVSSGCFFSLFR